MQPEKIVSVRKIGTVKTVDIEVDSKEHIYYGNGIGISNSHSIAYGIDGYYTAYAKTHFTKEFFCSWLRFSKYDAKPHKEVETLITDTRLFGVNVKGPDFRNKQTNFYILNDNIVVGLGNVKNVGESIIEKINIKTKECEILLGKERKDWLWMDILICFSDFITSTAFLALINSGAFSYLGYSRTRMSYEYDKWNQLNDNEKDWFKNEYITKKWPDFITAIQDGAKDKKSGGAARSAKGVEKMKNIITALLKPPFELTDNPSVVLDSEKKLIGCPISYNKIEDCTDVIGNCTCKEFIDGKSLRDMSIAIEIVEARTNVIKSGPNKGKKMAFVKGQDGTGCMDNILAFSETYENYGNLLVDGNTVLIKGYKGKDGSFIINEITQI